MKKLLLLLVIICFSNVCVQAATDNVLQSIQIDTFKDTYNIILKSDEKPEAKRVINDENKIMLTLKGVRVSQELNTVYNATNIDSVTVEPAGNDTVNVLIQAQNASHANLIFDTLDTPLGVLRAQDNKKADEPKQVKKHKKKIVLSHPVRDYRPVFEEDDEDAMSLDSLMSSEYASSVISMFKDDGITNAITILLIGLIILCTVRLFRRNSCKEENMKVGLTQSLNLRDREMGLMQDMMSNQQQYQAQQQMQQAPQPQPAVIRPEMNYGIRSYQNANKTPYQQATRSPYMSTDIKFNNQSLQQKMQEIRNNVQQQTASIQNLQEKAPAQVASAPLRANRTTQAGMQQRPISSSSRMTTPQQRVTNMDSMKFLDSMAKIYEKNGRSDLAQGLKAKISRV